MLPVQGRPILDWALGALPPVVDRVLVVVNYLAEQIEAHLATRRDIEIIVSRETELLDTGGGIKNALHHFDGKPFFALNAEPPWFDGATPNLSRMAQEWNPSTMERCSARAA